MTPGGLPTGYLVDPRNKIKIKLKKNKNCAKFYAGQQPSFGIRGVLELHVTWLSRPSTLGGGRFTSRIRHSSTRYTRFKYPLKKLF